MFSKTTIIAGLAGALTLLAACGGGGGETDQVSTNSADSAGAREQSSGQQAPESQPADESREVSTSGSDHACELATDAEVSAILGESVQPGQEGTGGSQGSVKISHCAWMAQSIGSKGLASVFLRKSTEKDAARVFDLGLESYPEAQEVKGLGVRAFYVPSMGQLNLLAGDTWYIVALQRDSDGGPPATVSDSQRELAELVLGAS